LVDCSAVWKGGQISNSNALQIARNLAAPFGINVTALCDPGRVVPQFNINIGESPGDILELITRNEGLLYYEDTAGNLVLARVGTDRAGSGFVEGQNVQQATVQRSMSDRHSEYTCSLVSIPTGPLYEAHDGLFFGTAKDPNVPRYRPLFLVAESGTGSLDLVKRRALWEAARRAGRGEQVRITVDSWRDGAGKLWTPNTLAPVSLPRLKLKEAGLCIGQVTHRLGLDTGRTAEITLMPKEAFLPQPIVLQAVIPNLVPKPGAAP
jgi:prophage tail gpP-like protein